MIIDWFNFTNINKLKLGYNSHYSEVISMIENNLSGNKSLYHFIFEQVNRSGNIICPLVLHDLLCWFEKYTN